MGEKYNFEIGNKAEQLYFSVFDLTTNRQHYPVKYRRLADKLQEYALEIYSDVLDANSFKTDTVLHKQKKYDLQTHAISTCVKFLSLTKYSINAHLISMATGEKWTSLVHDIKYMSLAWRKSLT